MEWLGGGKQEFSDMGGGGSGAVVAPIGLGKKTGSERKVRKLPHRKRIACSGGSRKQISDRSCYRLVKGEEGNIEQDRKKKKNKGKVLKRPEGERPSRDSEFRRKRERESWPGGELSEAGRGKPKGGEKWHWGRQVEKLTKRGRGARYSPPPPINGGKKRSKKEIEEWTGLKGLPKGRRGKKGQGRSQARERKKKKVSKKSRREAKSRSRGVWSVPKISSFRGWHEKGHAGPRAEEKKRRNTEEGAHEM